MWLACVDTPGQSPGLDANQSALDDPDFWFCHEPGASESTVKEWCEILGEAPPDKCPGMRETCAAQGELAAGARPPSGESCSGRPGGDDADPGAIAGDAVPPERATRFEPIRCDRAFDGSGLSRLLTWVGAFMVGALVLLMLRAFAGSFGAPRLPPRDVPPSRPEPGEDDALPDVPNLPSADLLEAARAALAQGRLGEAVLLARGAALRQLGEQSRLRLHRSRTDREYVRALRKQPDAQQELREVMDAVEHHRWGGAPLGEARARAAVSAVERLLTVTAAAFLWIGLAGVPLTAAAQTVNRFGPNGDAALREVLDNHGYDVRMRLRSLAQLDDEVDALVIDLDFVDPLDEHWTTIEGWVRDGGVLLVGGHPVYQSDFEAPVFPALGDHEEVHEPAAVVGSAWLGDLPVPVWPGGPAHVFTGGDAWVEVPGAGAAVAVVQVGAGVVIAIADTRLLWNGAFVVPDNERFLGELLYFGQATYGWALPTPARVQLATTSSVVTAGSSSSNNPLSSMNNARLAQFMGQLLVAWALLGLWRGWPFTPRRDPPSDGRLEFSEHVHALGTRWFRQGASRYALVQTARLWLARLGSSGLQLAARRAGKTPAQAEAWVVGLQDLVEDPHGPDDPSDLERMEELWKVTHPPA